MRTSYCATVEWNRAELRRRRKRRGWCAGQRLEASGNNERIGAILQRPPGSAAHNYTIQLGLKGAREITADRDKLSQRERCDSLLTFIKRGGEKLI